MVAGLRQPYTPPDGGSALGPYTAICGPARSGTTWLYRYLRDCSSVGTGWIKENDWFCGKYGLTDRRMGDKQGIMWRDIRELGADDVRELRPWALARKERIGLETTNDFRAFLERWNGPRRPVVDVSPRYAGLGVDAFRDMRDHFPDARVVILLRNPPDRVWSGAAHHKKVAAPDMTVKECYDARFQRMSENADAFNGTLNMLPCLYMTLLEVFPADRILPIFTEDLFGPDQPDVLDKLVTFMGGVRDPERAFEYSENMGVYDPMPDDLRRDCVRRYAQTYAFARALMGRLPDKWQADWTRFMAPNLTRTHQI